jgi:hypothetical protein
MTDSFRGIVVCSAGLKLRLWRLCGLAGVGRLGSGEECFPVRDRRRVGDDLLGVVVVVVGGGSGRHRVGGWFDVNGKNNISKFMCFRGYYGRIVARGDLVDASICPSRTLRLRMSGGRHGGLFWSLTDCPRSVCFLMSYNLASLLRFLFSRCVA